MSELTDENLVDASRAGDKDAYAVLAQRHYERVFVVCLDLMRRNKRGRQVVAREMTPADEMLVPYENLQRAIAKLPPESRQPLVTYYFGGESVKDVAKRMKLSNSTVYQRLRAATQQLHKLLVKQGDVL